MLCSRTYPVHDLLRGASGPGLLARLQAVRARVQTRGLPGLPTGLRTLDERLGGLHQGLHLLAGAPGAGKTTLALQIARSVAADGASVVYLAFDEDSERLALKLVAACGGLVAGDYLSGKADPEDLLKSEETHRDALAKIRIYSGPADIHGDVAGKMLSEAKGINGTEDGLLVVDFLQSWATRMPGISDTRLATAHLVAQLRDVASKYRVPVLAVMAEQGLGQGEGSVTSLSAWSGIDCSADSVWLLVNKGHTDESRRHRKVMLSCVQNRWGNLFSQPLILDAECGVFTEDLAAA